MAKKRRKRRNLLTQPRNPGFLYTIQTTKTENYYRVGKFSKDREASIGYDSDYKATLGSYYHKSSIPQWMFDAMNVLDMAADGKVWVVIEGFGAKNRHVSKTFSQHKPTTSTYELFRNPHIPE